MQLRTLGIASLLRSTMNTQRTCGFGRRQRLRTSRHGDFTLENTPPLEPDPADETVIIDQTGREVVEEEVVPPKRISLGTPIANTQLYVVDRNLQPQGIGIPGEQGQ